jgi:hypothetical protein
MFHSVKCHAEMLIIIRRRQIASTPFDVILVSYRPCQIWVSRADESDGRFHAGHGRYGGHKLNTRL